MDSEWPYTVLTEGYFTLLFQFYATFHAKKTLNFI